MLLLRAMATRWVSDDPQPGVVQIEFTDADGHTHHLQEKPTVIDAAGVMNRHAKFPIEVQIACRPRHQAYRPRERRTFNVVDLSPWGVDDPAVLYPVDRGNLSWSTPAAHSDLSIRARQAVALVTFRRWRESVGLDCVELATLEDHLWQYATVTPDTFNAWHDGHPLVHVGPDGPLPNAVHDQLLAHGLDPSDVRSAILALTQITYGGLFGRVESEWSLADLRALGRFTERDGTPLVTADGFVDSLWVDGDWGNPSEELVRRWRAAT
ncbi:hypothetical protein [Cellulosimicrobium marinum]|uniref:hypothetical protein n=1 Tax=Cellulosimicrobium marinum TaxID=1638992 RepID=UPI001E5EC002|nr:hypothetical protein [Cellulosimicrobium marinum]MCB7137527.1 hypothetical protein [Cellulosimicrobium marinum]